MPRTMYMDKLPDSAIVKCVRSTDHHSRDENHYSNHNFVINNFNSNYNSIEGHVGWAHKTLDPLESLETYYVPQATYEDQSSDLRCMPGTRVKVLEEARHRLISREGSHIVWISGESGTGKTIIALSLCDILAREPTVLLGGSFFFSSVADSIKGSIARYVVSTLATVLVRNEPACEEALVAELKKDPEFYTKTIKYQIENLLIKPLNSLKPIDTTESKESQMTYDSLKPLESQEPLERPKLSDSPNTFKRQIVFVIDGLDQCNDEKQLRELVHILADFKCRVPVKFLVTARPDPRIRKIRVHRSCLHPRFELYSVDLALVMPDTQQHIQTEFENSPAAPEWYTDRDPAELAEKAGGVFTFVAATVKHVLSAKDGLLREKRVREVKELKAKGLTGLNEMYAFILARTMDLSSSDREKVRSILAAIIASRTPQQVKTLAELLDLSPLKIRQLLVDLQAVVFVPEADDAGDLRVLQTSFVEFFFKSAPESLRVSESFGHDVLARGCLKRLAADDLRFNVSETKSSYTANPKIEPGIARSLRYACIAWPFHIYYSAEPSTYDSQIDSVLRRKFLFWLEVTSQIFEADHWPELLLRTAVSRAESPDAISFLCDAISFVRTFWKPIEFSAAHIYISALPFTPKESLVHQTFFPLYRGLVSVETFGIDTQGDSKITVAAVSPDGRIVVCVSSDGSVRMWKSGEKNATMLDHVGQVRTVTFSADSQMIATGSSDNSVRIWDVADGQLIMPAQKGHQGPVQAVAFSPDATNLASGSADKTVQVWKVKKVSNNWQRQPQYKVAQILALLWSSGAANSPVSSAAYSPDGNYLASGYVSGTVQIVQAATGRNQYSIPYQDHNAIKSLLFSPDGKLIWMASGQKVFCVDPLKRASRFSMIGHTAQVNMIARSPNGQFIVSCANDASIRVWSADTGNTRRLPFLDHNGPVVSVAVSTKSDLLCSVGSDGTIREWDLTRVLSSTARILLNRLGEKGYEQDSGWLVDSSPSKQRLLWVPPEYHDDIKVSIDSRIIAAHWMHVGVTSKDANLYYGEEWAKCWIGGR